jgi:8-oxo-dGTP pyrophosphatase MutT (NUDIX family)
LLVTSRETQRWVIPKGWPWPAHTDWDSAAGEAREEAGVTGTVETVCFGTYVYGKRHPQGITQLTVDAFILWVTHELGDWPERDERKRQWFSLAEAANVVEEPQLRAMLKSIADLPATRGT